MIDAIATLDRYRYTLQGVYRRGHDPQRYCQELCMDENTKLLLKSRQEDFGISI